LAGYAWIVPPFGALGAAIVLLGGRLIGTIVCLVWLPFIRSPEAQEDSAVNL
jgi:hypothetical protein